MTSPIYIPDFALNEPTFEAMLLLPWLTVREARSECFMAYAPLTYTYGVGEFAQAYTAIPYHTDVLALQERLNTLHASQYNVCFLNRYDTQKHQLGWHSDDSPGMLHEHPIAVVSLGASREIWWREKGQTGVIPENQRQPLGHGSLFIMPPGFQRTHQHRIPKADRTVGTRISFTFRRYVPCVP